jgi:drug/metabolite transporter (DMT)-like permease
MSSMTRKKSRDKRTKQTPRPSKWILLVGLFAIIIGAGLNYFPMSTISPGTTQQSPMAQTQGATTGSVFLPAVILGLIMLVVGAILYLRGR